MAKTAGNAASASRVNRESNSTDTVSTPRNRNLRTDDVFDGYRN
jgi:hypothetical protein